MKKRIISSLVATCCFVVALYSLSYAKENVETRNETTPLTSYQLTKPIMAEWKDNNHIEAPKAVQEAVNNLWAHVLDEGAAAFSKGFGMKRAVTCGNLSCPCICWRSFCCLITLGCTECCCYDSRERLEWDYGPPDRHPWYKHEGGGLIIQRLSLDLQYFRQLVNKCVKNSLDETNLYEKKGLNNICALENLWDEDGRWKDHSIYYSISSVHRSFKNVSKSTMAFVNSRGGWDAEKSKTIYISPIFVQY